MTETLQIIETKRRRITKKDIESMAKLVAKRITETGACLMLGIKPETWFNFKLRQQNQSKFEESIAHFRESKLNDCLESIDKAGDEISFQNEDGTHSIKRGDWRAKAWLAERVLAPERLGQQQTGQPQVQIFAGDSAVRAVLEKVYNRTELTYKEPKQLPSVTVAPAESKI